jgi:hypothetical protein
MKELVAFLLIIVFLFVIIAFIFGTNYTEKYVDFGDEIIPEIQNAALGNINASLQPLDRIKSNMATSSSALQDIISKQAASLTDFNAIIGKNISDLTDSNTKLNKVIKDVKKEINGTVITVTESFENNSYLPNINNGNKLNNKESLTEYFYNYVPPKQQVYEGFFDWKEEWNRKISDMGLSLSLNPSTEIDGKDTMKDKIPIVYNPDMTKNMNETASKIISLAVTDNEQELLKSWRQARREN